MILAIMMASCSGSRSTIQRHDEMALIYNGIAVMPRVIGAGVSGSPVAPSGLTATAEHGYTRIKLNWADNSSNEDGFKIERSADGSTGWSQIDTTATNINYYTDSGLSRGATWYYRVRAYNGGGNSTYSANANDTVFQLSDITLFAEYDANVDAYEDAAGTDPCEDADGVWVLKDQANSYDLTQATAGARPSYQTAELNGLPIIRHASGDVMKAAAAADWKFLHDGTQCAVYIVWKTASSNPDASYILLDTGAASSAETGYALYYDDRASVPRTDQLNYKVAKGAGGNYEIDGITTKEAAAGGEWHITATRFNGTVGETWNDGNFGGYDTDTADGSPSASNPTSALAVGARYDNTFNLVGDWARILIVSGAVTDAQHKELTTYLAEEYALPNLSFFEAETVIEHDVSDPDQNGFVGLGLASNGDLVMGYTKATTHAAHDGDLIIRISTDGGDTWGAEDIIWDYSSDGGGTDEWTTPGFTTLSDGTMFMEVGLRESGAAVVDGIGYFKSVDNGANWTGPTQLTSAIFTAFSAEGGGILELANGDLLYPYYGRDTGDAANRNSCAVLRSQNGGDTWSHLAIVADGPTDIKDYTEIGLVQISNDDVIALIRELFAAPNEVIRSCISANNGATWGATSYIVTASALPRPLLLSTGEIISPQRSNDANERAIILYSADEGASWQLGHRFIDGPNTSGGRMTYAQFQERGDGIIHLAYGDEAASTFVSDVLYVKTAP